MKLSFVLFVLLLEIVHGSAQNVPGMICKVDEYYDPDEGCKSCFKLCEKSSYSPDRCYQKCPAMYVEIYVVEPLKGQHEIEISSLKDEQNKTKILLYVAIGALSFLGLVVVGLVAYIICQRQSYKSTDRESGGESKETLESLLRENAEVENLNAKQDEVEIAMEDNKREEVEEVQKEEDNVNLAPSASLAPSADLINIHAQPTADESSEQHKMHIEEIQQLSTQPAS